MDKFAYYLELNSSGTVNNNVDWQLIKYNDTNITDDNKVKMAGQQKWLEGSYSWPLNCNIQRDTVFQFGGSTDESTSRLAFFLLGKIYIFDNFKETSTHGPSDCRIVDSSYNSTYSKAWPTSKVEYKRNEIGMGYRMQYCYNKELIFIMLWTTSGWELYSSPLSNDVQDGDTLLWTLQATMPSLHPNSGAENVLHSALSYNATDGYLLFRTGATNGNGNDWHNKYYRAYDIDNDDWLVDEYSFDYQSDYLNDMWQYNANNSSATMTQSKDPEDYPNGGKTGWSSNYFHPVRRKKFASKVTGAIYEVGGYQHSISGGPTQSTFSTLVLSITTSSGSSSGSSGSSSSSSGGSEETEATSAGIATEKVTAIKEATITMSGTKGAPATAALDAIKDSLTGNKAEINRKRRAAIKLLFAGDNASTAKQLVIPRAKLSLPNTFVQAKVVAVKPGTPSSPPDPVSVADMDSDEGFYSALADGEIFLVTLPSGNTYTFTRGDEGSEERYTVDISGGSWTGISVNKLTGCANFNTSDPSASGSYLVQNDVVGIDGRRFFIGSVGDGGNEIFTGGDPYITPMYGNTYKLPVDEKIYRMFDNNKETDRFLINVEMKKPNKEYAEALNKKILALNPDADPNSVFFSENMSFMTRVFIQCGNQGLIYDLEEWKLIDKTDNCHVVIEDMDVNRPTMEEYQDEKRVTRRMVFKTKTMGDMIVYVEKYENPQIRSGLNVSQNTNTTNFVGALIRQSKPESIQVNSLVSREMLGKDALVECEADTLSIEYFGNVKTGQKGIRIFK